MLLDHKREENMIKNILLITLFLLYSPTTQSSNIDMKNLDAQSRAQAPNTNSIMFRKNAEQYKMLSDKDKAEIAASREKAREYYRQQEEMARRQAKMEAQRKAMEEEAKRREEALKPITLYENKLKIYALVNGEVITSNDMQNRINAFILTTGIPYNNQTKSMIEGKVLQAAIDEKLKIQEAQKNNIQITQKEIDSALLQFERSNNIPKGEFEKILNKAKVNLKTWTSQIEADLAWRKLISTKGYNFININENDINEAINQVKKDMSVQKYMVSEIVIDKKDAKDIHQLVENLRQDPRFELYAMQFSQSPSAANGGKLGWISKGTLPELLEKKIYVMKEGDVSDAILYGNDYYIFKLEKIFNPKTDTPQIPSKEEMRTFLENKKLEEYSNRYIKNLRSRALIEKKV